MLSGIVGREEELASLNAFVANFDEGSAALMLEGEAGIGKSTLWHAGVDGARASGLACALVAPGGGRARPRPRRSGRSVRDVLDDVLPALSAPRRRALEVALLREDAAGDSVDHRALAVAVRDVLQLLGEQSRFSLRSTTLSGSTPASSSALAFALRRTGREPRARLLLARRLVDATQPSELERRARRGARRAGAGGAAQRRRAPSAPARPPRQDLCAPDVAPHPRAVGRESVLRAGAGPRSRRGRRPARAAPGSRDARGARSREARRASRDHARRARARVGARDAVGVASASGRGSQPDALEPAFAAHVDRARERDDPLHAPAAVVGALPRSRRTSASASTRRLAEIVDDPLLRARHLALSSDAPDAAIAAHARRRGEARGRARRVRGRGRARRARAAADAAGRRERAPSSRARCGPCASRRRRVDARADDRRASCSTSSGIGLAARRGARPARRARGPRPRRRAARGGAARGDSRGRRCSR